MTLIAERGRLAITDEGPRVILVNGNRQQARPGKRPTALLYFDRYSVDLGKIVQAQQNRWREPRERFLHELPSPSADPNDQPYAGRAGAEAHSRLAAPLLGDHPHPRRACRLLSGDFNRRGQGRRLFVAIGIGIALLTGWSRPATRSPSGTS